MENIQIDVKAATDVYKNNLYLCRSDLQRDKTGGKYTLSPSLFISHHQPPVSIILVVLTRTFAYIHTSWLGDVISCSSDLLLDLLLFIVILEHHLVLDKCGKHLYTGSRPRNQSNPASVYFK